MANYTAADVKKLRDATGAGMMDAKKALETTDGDFEKAIEELRIHGAAKAAKRGAERSATNGLVAAAENALVQLNCETDFVAKNEQFQQLAADIVAHAAASKVGDVEGLLSEKLSDGKSVAANIEALAAVIGEKLELGKVAVFDGQVAAYMHKRAADLPAQVGVLVEFEGDNVEAARGAAMQAAAMRPLYTTRDEVPAETVENEKRIAEATALDDLRQSLLRLAFLAGGRLGDPLLVLDRLGRDIDEEAGIVTETLGTETSPASSPLAPAYHRVLLKLSGEVFGGGKLGVDPDVVNSIAKQIADVARAGVQVAVVVGGGNFFRGAELQQRGMERNRADYMGMLGTVMNCLALQDFLEKLGIETRVQTAITMGQVAEPYIPRKAERHLEKGRVVIFGAGSGMPYFSTDTVAAQRALEIGAEALLMGKQGVDGVYDSDPKRNPDAVKFDQLSYDDFLARGLRVADATAISLARDNALPIVIFGLEEGNIARVVHGEKIGTVVSPGQ